MDYSKLNRLEVIGNGRELVYYGKYTLSIQDDGKTLKIFLPEDELPITSNQINKLKEVDIINTETNIYHKSYKTVYILDKSIFDNTETLTYYKEIVKMFSQIANRIDNDIKSIFELRNDEFDLYLIHQFYKNTNIDNIKIIDYVVLKDNMNSNIINNYDYIYIEFKLLDFILNRLNDIKSINYKQVSKIRELIDYKSVDLELKDGKIEHCVIRSINLKDILDILNNK